LREAGFRPLSWAKLRREVLPPEVTTNLTHGSSPSPSSVFEGFGLLGERAVEDSGLEGCLMVNEGLEVVAVFDLSNEDYNALLGHDMLLCNQRCRPEIAWRRSGE